MVHFILQEFSWFTGLERCYNWFHVKTFNFDQELHACRFIKSLKFVPLGTKILTFILIDKVLSYVLECFALYKA